MPHLAMMQSNVFTPRSISGLQAWWNPDSGITKNAVTNRISSWVDVVGGHTVSQATGAQQPLYVAASANMNSRPSIQFDVQPQMLTITSAPANLNVQQGQFTYLAVARGANDVMGNSVAIGSFLLMLFSSKVRAHVWYTVLKTQDGLTTVSSTTKAMVGQMADATTLYPILNGAKDNVGIAIGTPTTPTTTINIGSRGSGASFLGFMGDVFIFNKALSNAELTQMYNWAKAKWAL